MTAALPKGLLANTENISGDLERIDHVEIEDLTQLWRVYSTNRAILEDDVGSRLENFFWRIWSNPRIYPYIRGSTLARLFVHISQGTGFIRTTPTQSPRGSSSASSRRTNQRSRSGSPSQRTPTARSPDLRLTSPSVEMNNPERSKSSRHTSDPKVIPSPVLKKTRTGSDDPPKTARILSPKQQVEFGSSSATPGPAGMVREEPTAPPATAKAEGRKKPGFIGSTTKTRRRPAIVRRKSSQSSSSTASSKKSPTLPSQKVVPFSPPPGLEKSRAASHPMKTFRVSDSFPVIATASPSPFPGGASWQDVDSEAATSSHVEPSQPSSWLVDKDFRSRFVEQRLQVNKSAASLASLASNQGDQSTVHFLDEIQHEEKDKAREAGPKPRPPKSLQSATSTFTPPSPPSAPHPATEAVNHDDGAPPPAPLPRTKSQLSMMIAKDRGMSEPSAEEMASTRNYLR